MRGRAVPRGNLAGLAERSDELELLNFGERTEWHAEERRDFRVYELDFDGARRLSADLFGSPLGGRCRWVDGPATCPAASATA